MDTTVPAAKSVKAYHTPDAYWVKSWLQLNEEGKITKIICEWMEGTLNQYPKP